MSDQHTLESNRSGDSPKPPRVYPRLNRRLTILKWLAFLGGVVLLGGGAFDYYRSEQLSNSGQQVVGKLHESGTLDAGKGRTAYKLTLDYTPEGSTTTYRKEFAVSEQTYHTALGIGAATVKFLPSDPEYSKVEGESSPDLEPLAMGAGLLLVSLGVFWYQRRQGKQVEAFVWGDHNPNLLPANGSLDEL